MGKCSNCGAMVDKGTDFCPNCGERFYRGCASPTLTILLVFLIAAFAVPGTCMVYSLRDAQKMTDSGLAYGFAFLAGIICLVLLIPIVIIWVILARRKRGR